uniref:FecR domain-containing protein n=1 Tax=Aliarcobacter sp. TaxID=2321116 RepID=UPI0040472929
MSRIIIIFVFLVSSLYASIGKITSLEGKASITRDNTLLIAVMGSDIEKHDVISTESNSKLKIKLVDNTIISIGKESSLNIQEYVFDVTNPKESKTELNFVKGTFHAITGHIGKINPSKFKLKTKSASIGIRGTEIYGNTNQVACLSGTIEVTSFGETVVVPSGNFLEVYSDKFPSSIKKIDTEFLNKIKNEMGVSATENQEEKKSSKKNTQSVQIDSNDSEVKIEQPSTEKIEDKLKKYVNKKLTGYHLGYLNDYESTDFTFNSNSKMQVYNKKIVFGEYSGYLNSDNSNYNVTKSGELFLNTSLTNGSYSFHHNLGKLSYSQNIDSTKYYGNYNIHADNLAEFIVGYSDETWNTNNTYKDLFYNGLVSSKSVLDKSYIYEYKGYKGLTLNGADTSFHDISNRYLYINTKTGYISSRPSSNVEKSGWEFNLGKINTDGTITAKSYVYKIKNDGVEIKNSSSVSGQLYGSDGQGIGLNGQVENDTLTSLDSRKANNLSETYYLKKITSNNLTNSENFSGLSSQIKIDSTNSIEIDSTKSISLSLNKNTGNISSGTISDYNFQTSNNDLNSYYIDDDNFGVLIESCNSCGTMTSNSSWMVSIGDKVNTDNTITSNLDNESSWGYWTANFKDSENSTIRINPYSSWVAGNKNTTYLTDLISSSTIKELNFKGNIIGAIVTGTNFNAIKLDTNNLINFKFSLGNSTNSFTGNFAFDTSAGKSWSGDFAGNLTASEFNTTSFSNLKEVNKNLDPNTTSSLTINSSSLKGNYFGTNDIKSVGGVLNVKATNSDTNDISTMIGSFKADKITP